MASVTSDRGASAPHLPQPENDTGAWERARFALDAERTRRQLHRQFGVGLLIVLAIVAGLLALLVLGGPRPEDPLPNVPAGTAGVAGSTAPWDVCDVYTVRLICRNSTDSMDLVLANQRAVDELCRALPCRRHQPITNGNLER